jgi:hypothetical protein
MKRLDSTHNPTETEFCNKEFVKYDGYNTFSLSKTYLSITETYV